MNVRNIRLGADENVRIRVDRLDGYVLKVRVYLYTKGLEASEWYAIEPRSFEAFVAGLHQVRDGARGPLSLQSLSADFSLAISVSARGFLACEANMKRSAVYPEKLKYEGWSIVATFGIYPASITLRESGRKHERKNA